MLGKNGPMAAEFFTKVIHINLIGTFLCDKAAAAIMQTNAPNADGERGLIIHTSSVAAFEGQIGQSDYSAAKGGVIGMTLTAARDLAPLGVRVMTIAPGTFFTPAYKMDEADAQAKWGPLVPNPKRMGHADEYAQLALTIAQNDYLNGTTIRIDGAQRF